MPRVAAIDCGTNSIRLLVADLDPKRGTLTEVDRRLEIVRLGQDVDRTGRLAPEALTRTFTACKAYAARIAELGVELDRSRVRFVATSATRDAANRAEFVTGIRAILGVEPEVISGDEEARLSFDGATRELGPLDVTPPFLVVDIGGGSTEFVLGTQGEPQSAISVDMGCVRLTERYLPSDPPTQGQLDEARREIDRLIDKAALTVPLGEARTMVALAGTATTVAAMALDLPAYDPGQIHLSRISVNAIAASADRFLWMTHEQRAALPYMHPGRVDVIGGGALILERIARRVEPSLRGADIVISEHDILDGMAWSLVR